MFEETLGQPTPGGQTPIRRGDDHPVCTDDLGVDTTKTTTTAADGTYSFTGLRPGTCNVTQTQPPGYLSAPNTPATAIPLTVTEGSISDTNYFGELKVGQIGNFVWEDLNGDGIQDAGEPGIAGVSVTLTGTDSFGTAVNQTTTTDGSGLYAFSNLNPGSYTVAFATPAGYLPTAEDEGADNAKDSDGASETVTLGSGESNQTLDSGFVKPASVGNFVWNDLDGDGIQDAGEPGIVGATVTLTGTDGAGNPVNETATTDATGAYLFDGLQPGSYTVAFTTPLGTDPSPADIGNDGSDSDGAVRDGHPDLGRSGHHRGQRLRDPRQRRRLRLCRRQ